MTTILHGGRRYGKTLEQSVFVQIATVQRYLEVAGVWSRPESSNYFDDYAYYRYGRMERKWYRDYNRRMAAKHMVKMYLLIKGFPNGTANT